MKTFKPGDVVVASAKYRSSLITTSEKHADGFMRSKCCGFVVDPKAIGADGSGTLFDKFCPGCGKQTMLSTHYSAKRRYLALSVRDGESFIVNQRTHDKIPNASLCLFPLDGSVKQKLLYVSAYECDMAEDQAPETRGPCASTLAERFLKVQQSVVDHASEGTAVYHGSVRVEDIPKIERSGKRSTFAGVTFSHPVGKRGDSSAVPRPALRKILEGGKVRAFCNGEYSDDYAFDAAVDFRRGEVAITDSFIEECCRPSYASVYLSDGAIRISWGFKSYSIKEVDEAEEQIKREIERLKKENAELRARKGIAA